MPSRKRAPPPYFTTFAKSLEAIIGPTRTHHKADTYLEAAQRVTTVENFQQVAVYAE